MCQVLFKIKKFTSVFIRFVSAVRLLAGHLVTPPLHFDALPIIAGELALFAACQLQQSCVWLSLSTLIVIIWDCPLVFAKKIGELGGSRHGGHIRLGISQDPLAGCLPDICHIFAVITQKLAIYCIFCRNLRVFFRCKFYSPNILPV